MASQTTFYQPDPSLDASIAPESLFLGQEFSPEYLSLSLLEKDDQHPEMPFEAFQYQAHQNQMQPMPTIPAESDMNRPRLRNRALRPAPPDSRRGSADDMNQPPFYSYGSIPSYSSFSSNNSNPHEADQDFRFSPHSDMSSNKSTSPLRWQTGDTEKRAKHLERNRAAASKSRQKKKRETDQLRTRFQEASRRKSGLEIEIKELHSQLLSLKDQILMHSRCDDEAIHMYLGRMVKQATKYDSFSSASSGEPDCDDRDRKLERRHASDSISPRQAAVSLQHPHPHGRPNQFESDISNGQQFPMRMGDGGLPCGVEKPMMNQMFNQHDQNIFDLQISIS
ncbi:bZIP transcription factor [Aspergillus mulundensis]|uniref:BZIP domain-containing protein n=1 Tax=Aspergillus mulundensis TaxID=1810919 RepID=A0A3D8RF72_9EURO|nr:hypothetical protein DSM5745_07867 [Aspergillus mulundensis]RDW72695.1 hypothetical protein DSM5745_07867 [Aspergillus mulundensis]